MIDQILVVEPDSGMRDRLRACLHGYRFDTSTLHDASMLLTHVDRRPPSLIVLRVGDPVARAYAALQALREAGHDMPVIVLSDSASIADKVVALETGADDYLVDPFDLMEFVARVRRAAHRYRSSPSGSHGQPARRTPYRFGEIEVDFVNRRATRAGIDLGLRASEFALLDVFVSHPMRVLSRTEIQSLLGQRTESRSVHALAVLVFRLRGVVEQATGDYHYIRTVRGKGYVFTPSGEQNGDSPDDAT